MCYKSNSFDRKPLSDLIDFVGKVRGNFTVDSKREVNLKLNLCENSQVPIEVSVTPDHCKVNFEVWMKNYKVSKTHLLPQPQNINKFPFKIYTKSLYFVGWEMNEKNIARVHCGV